MGEDTGIANRLRKRDSHGIAIVESGDQNRRSTRSMNIPPSSRQLKSIMVDITPKTRQLRRRERKSNYKESSLSDGSDLEESKIKFVDNYSKREKYFNQGNAVYQEYDDFLKKRRKDKRIEFISLKREPNEEVLSSKGYKDLFKYLGASTSDQDTF